MVARHSRPASSLCDGRSTMTPVLTLLASALTYRLAATAQIADPAALVNLFIGTTNGGHVFPGEYNPQWLPANPNKTRRCHIATRNGESRDGHRLPWERTPHVHSCSLGRQIILSQQAGYDRNSTFNVRCSVGSMRSGSPSRHWERLLAFVIPSLCGSTRRMNIDP